MDLLGNDSIKIELEKDAAYFLVEYTDIDVKREILSIIKKNNILGVDYNEIDESLKKRKKRILISKDLVQFSEDEEMDIKVSPDEIYAIAIFKKPKLQGRMLTQSAILAKLIERGIEKGINFDEIDRFLEERDYSKKYILAKGTSPEPSEDAYIKFHIDVSEQNYIPQVLEDGSLDYKTLNLFNQVKKGDVLAEKVDAVTGAYGINIYGREIPSTKPNDNIKLPKGKNTTISEDGSKLIAEIGGKVLFEDEKIDIIPVLILDKGVNNSTGNIKFEGNVIINGTVLNGFQVEADGDIQVNGSVEAANIISGQSIFITRGIQGNKKSKIYAKNTVNAQFMENVYVFAEKDINASVILNSEIQCGCNLKLIGKKAIIIGGKATVGGDVFAKVVGSEMNSNTEIRLGVHPRIFEKYEHLTSEVEQKYEKYEKLEKIIKFLSEKDISTLTEEKSNLLLNSIKEKMDIKKRLSKIKNDLSMITPLFTKRIGKLEAFGNIYPGTKIVANNAVLFIKDTLGACIIKNFEGKVEILNNSS